MTDQANLMQYEGPINGPQNTVSYEQKTNALSHEQKLYLAVGALKAIASMQPALKENVEGVLTLIGFGGPKKRNRKSKDESSEAL